MKSKEKTLFFSWQRERKLTILEYAQNVFHNRASSGVKKTARALRQENKTEFIHIEKEGIKLFYFTDCITSHVKNIKNKTKVFCN